MPRYYMAKLWEFYNKAGMDTRAWVSDAVRTLAEAYCYEKCVDDDESRKKLLKEMMKRVYTLELPDKIAEENIEQSECISDSLDVIVESGVPVILGS